MPLRPIGRPAADPEHRAATARPPKEHRTMHTRSVLRKATLATAVLATVVGAGIVATSSAEAASTLTMRGADVSSLQRGIDVGAKYYTASGAQADPLDILRAAGVNYVRLRVWNS